jgi:hypothetical protein
MNNEELNRIIMKAEDEYELLKDRVHDLQEENKILKKDNNCLKSIIEKAVEYIKYNDDNLYTFEPDYDYEENMVDNYEPSNFKENLLNLLNGDEDE